jgi:hypothetical protein
MSNTIVFGSQVTIIFDDGRGNTETPLIEVSNFSSKADDIVKKNSSLGETGVGSIDVLHDGGTMSFEAKLTDARLLTYLFAQDVHHRASNELGKRGKTPYINVREVIEFTDGSTVTINHLGTVLHNPDRGVQSKNDEYIIKVEGTYKRVELEVSGDLTTASSGEGLSAFVSALANFEQNQAYQDADYKEVTPLSYLIGDIF